MATTLTPSAHRPNVVQAQDHLPRRKDGQVKGRTSRLEKLCVLFPGAHIKRIEAHLEAFATLFAFRKTDASITRNNQGPRAWTAIKGLLTVDHLIRHLLADRMPTLPPKWVAVRSLATSKYFVLDIDPDRTKPEEPHHRSRHTKAETRAANNSEPGASKLSFNSRCRWAESCLARLGIDASDPRAVLIQPSPSGGRHYYVFLDSPYLLDQIKQLLEAAGLRFTKSQIEFYPSTSHAIRLPFGYMPLHAGPHPWRDWVKFIENYRRSRIKRHSLAELHEQLEQSQREQQSCPHLSSPPTPKEPANTQPSAPTSRHGIPRRFQPSRVPNPDTQADQRYWQLLHDGPQSVADAQEQMQLGIRQEGTRNQALMHLAQHLIFIRGYSAEKATAELITWAMNPQHRSKDIQRDLAKGTRSVEKEIDRVCRWHESHRDPSRKSASNHYQVGFAPTEIDSLRHHLSHLSPEERKPQAQFLLHFLNFAKQYGSPSKNTSGWEATPAVNAVIRKWPGCHHLNYKTRINTATALGLLSVTKGAWHNPNGKGRARTYHLAIPVVPKNEWSLSYDDALNQLINGPVVVSEVQSDALAPPLATPASPSDKRSCHKEVSHVHRRNNRQPSYFPAHGRRPHHNRVHPALVRPQGPRVCVAPRPRQRTPQSHEDPRLRRPHPEQLPTFHSRMHPQHGLPRSGLPP